MQENIFGVLTSSKISLRSLGVKWLRPIILTISPHPQNFNHDHSPRPWSQHHPGTELDRPDYDFLILCF